MISDVQMVTMAIRGKVDANLVCVQVVMEAECNTLTHAVWIRAPTFRVLSVTAGGATLVSRVIETFFSCEEFRLPNPDNCQACETYTLSIWKY